MLSQLYIKNLAVIQEVTVELSEGLNVFTGETGAGKSVIIGAINAILGGRVFKDQVRTGEHKACVSALFTGLNQTIQELLEEKGFSTDEDGCLLITREFTSDGRNSCRINARPAPLSVLREIGGLLMDIHGQRDNNRLLEHDYQMETIDRFGNLTQMVDSYLLEYRQLTAIQKEMQSLQMDEGEKARRLDLLQYQMDEIEQADLKPDEEEELSIRRRQLQNSQRILSSLAQARENLSGDEEGEYSGAIVLLQNACAGLEEASRYLPDMASTAEKLQEMVYELQELSGDLSDELSAMEYQPSGLDEIEERLDEIYRLKRKYGASYKAIMEFYHSAKQQMETICFAQDRIHKLEKEYDAQRQRVNVAAQELSARREQATQELIHRLEEELIFLDMPNVHFSIENILHSPSESGIDNISLLITANVGERPKPLSRIASGGELSRIMLALKNIMWSLDEAGTMVFDEVDTGVSGRAAQKIGRKLAQAALHRQVICVTHLAQIAVCGQNHLLIEKQSVQERTYTSVTPLEGHHRLEELARIISGDHITESALHTAAEMLEQFNWDFSVTKRQTAASPNAAS